MEIEQNATFLKTRAAPLASDPMPSEASLLPETGFFTLLGDAAEAPAEPEAGPTTISVALPRPIAEETAKDSKASAPQTLEISVVPALTAVAKPDDTAPADTQKTDLPAAVFADLPAVSAAFSASVAAPIAGVSISLGKDEKPEIKSLQAPTESLAKPSIKAEIVQATVPDPVRANATAAPAPAAVSLVAFFEPDRNKPIEAALPVQPKELAQPPANRSPATPAFQYITPALMPIAENTKFSLLDTGVEPEFTVTLRTERASLESGAALPAASRVAPPVQAQIAAQFPTQIAKNTQQVIELRLDPPELGRVVIHITTQDQSVTAQILADRPDTVDLMRRHAEFLTNALEKAGFSQSNLSFQQGGSQPQKDQTQFQLGHAETQPAEPSVSTEPARHTDGRLDIRL